uniref:Uncharacterized protein n=1 Tax=Cryptomonas curvata TaxID=233186 RepID=A0A6T8E135_9CRYP
MVDEVHVHAFKLSELDRFSCDRNEILLVWDNWLHKGNRLAVAHCDGNDADAQGHSETDQIIPELHAATEKVCISYEPPKHDDSRLSHDDVSIHHHLLLR